MHATGRHGGMKRVFKMGKKKFKTFFLAGPGDRESVISCETFKTVVIRILAHRPSQKAGRMRDCCFKSLHDFHDDEVGQEWDADDHHFRYFTARQLANIGHFLRKSILKHRWNEAAHLTQLLCNPGLVIHRSTIFSACYLLLLNHPKSNTSLLEKFVSQCTQYVLPEEVKKFIKIIFAIREKPLTVQHVGKHIRRKEVYKAVDEFCFKDL